MLFCSLGKCCWWNTSRSVFREGSRKNEVLSFLHKKKNVARPFVKVNLSWLALLFHPQVEKQLQSQSGSWWDVMFTCFLLCVCVCVPEFFLSSQRHQSCQDLNKPVLNYCFFINKTQWKELLFTREVYRYSLQNCLAHIFHIWSSCSPAF